MRRFTRAIAMAGLAATLMAPAAFAQNVRDPQDDKNNSTSPGVGNGVLRSERALENALENCDEHSPYYDGRKGSGSANLPAQCQ